MLWLVSFSLIGGMTASLGDVAFAATIIIIHFIVRAEGDFASATSKGTSAHGHVIVFWVWFRSMCCCCGGSWCNLVVSLDKRLTWSWDKVLLCEHTGCDGCCESAMPGTVTRVSRNLL